jgi:hypothetical protein
MPRDLPLTPRPAAEPDASVRFVAAGWPLCPSARPEMLGSTIFGVIGGDVDEPRVSYLADPQPVSDDLLTLAEPLAPTEVFRFAAPCGGGRCRHYDGAECRLATRVVTMLPTVTDRLPRCRIRPSCRWWHQEGAAACRRCPQIVSESANPTQLQRRVAEPS